MELADETRTERLAWWRADIRRLVDEFIAAVEAGREPAITGHDARAALGITLAANSGETGRPVSLPL